MRSAVPAHRPQGPLAVAGPASVLLAIAAFALGRRRVSLLRVALQSLVKSVRGVTNVLPTWPPPPHILVRQGSVFVTVAGMILALASFCRGPASSEEEESFAWTVHEQKQRLSVLGDLLQRVPLERLCEVVPHLRQLLTREVPERATDTGLASEMKVPSDSDAVTDFPVTAEAVADASEKLAKVQRHAPMAWEGYAIAAALTAAELHRSVDAARAAVALVSGPGQDKAFQSAAASIDALRLRVTAAKELASQVLVQCPDQALARRIAALYAAALHHASRAVRAHQAAQWQRAVQLLWRFRYTLPYLALSSALSMVLGAFSAMQLHYRAAVINLAREAVTKVAETTGGSAALRNGQSLAMAGIGETIGAMVMSEVIIQLAEFIRARSSLRGKARVVQGLKVALFEALLRQDLEYLEQCDLWQLRSLIGSCGTTVGQVVDFPAVVVEATCRLFAAVLVLWRQSPQMTCFLAVALPLRAALARLVDAAGDRLEQRSCLPDFRGQINACWSALVRPASFRTLRAFAREPLEAKSFTRFLAAHDRLQERGSLIYRLQQPLHAVLEHGTEIAAMWYGGRLAVRGKLAFGELSSVVLVAQGAFDGARYTHAAALGVTTNAVGPLSQMASLLSQCPRIGLHDPPYERMPDPSSVQWRITFEEVCFEYPQRPGAPVLQGLSFEAYAGEFLGILGSTGAGKSTVFALLLRFYEPTAGRILLDGRDLRSYNPLWLRRHIGFVSQDLVLCNRTIRENLVYGCIGVAGLPDLPDDEARRALKIAQCEETFFNATAFPNLWHTDVGESGSDLSGGERQRLAIARAIAKKPRLLLLDEATSALDELSQAHLQEALEELRRQESITVLCIAHRLSNLSQANRLLVLADGRAAERGTPAELLATPGGCYAEYVRAHHQSVPNVPAGPGSSPADGCGGAD